MVMVIQKKVSLALWKQRIRFQCFLVNFGIKLQRCCFNSEKPSEILFQQNSMKQRIEINGVIDFDSLFERIM